MNDDPDRLTPAEEKKWRKVQGQPNTVEDWKDLNRTLVGYRRRFLERHEPRRRKRTKSLSPVAVPRARPQAL